MYKDNVVNSTANFDIIYRKSYFLNQNFFIKTLVSVYVTLFKYLDLKYHVKVYIFLCNSITLVPGYQAFKSR